MKDCLAQLSTLSETLQDININIVDANKNIKWTINALTKIKTAGNDGKYDFTNMVGKSLIFKVVALHEYVSRTGYVSFSKVQLVQSIIDNITSRMLNKNNKEIL